MIRREEWTQEQANTPKAVGVGVKIELGKFHMDDSLEKPSALSQKSVTPADEVDDQVDSEGEDAAPDWIKLAPRNVSVIPKRGEKEFEPRAGGESGLQAHFLQRSRNAMFDALRGTRTTSSKGISYGIYYPDLARTHITIARGTHLASMGHSTTRSADQKKRLELLPEETIYLVERGALMCWKYIPSLDLSELKNGLVDEEVLGSAMSVQQVYTEMINQEGLSLDKFQVYSYLRRLGYVVTRTEPPSPAYPRAAPFPKPSPHSRRSIFTIALNFLDKIARIFTRAFDWWKPLGLHHNYPSIYKSLRFLAVGHRVPLHVKQQGTQTPYKIFYNIYKPATTYRKTAPPPPDYSVVVVDARTTPMPTLHELTMLFGQLPELPPPVPKQRRPQEVTKTKEVSPLNNTTQPPSLFHWFPLFFQTKTQPVQPRKPNPFPHLRQGKKMVVVAAVDSGNISFFRFSEGAFEDWPMNLT